MKQFTPYELQHLIRTANTIAEELRGYGKFMRTQDSDYHFSKFSLKRVVKWANDITVELKDAIE